MPAVSRAQRRLFGAAEHGATFPMAEKLRGSMSHSPLHDFAATPEKGLPLHVAGLHPNRNLGRFLHPKATTLGDRVKGMRVSGAFRPVVPRGTSFRQR